MGAAVGAAGDADGGVWQLAAFQAVVEAFGEVAGVGQGAGAVGGSGAGDDGWCVLFGLREFGFGGEYLSQLGVFGAGYHDVMVVGDGDGEAGQVCYSCEGVGGVGGELAEGERQA